MNAHEPAERFDNVIRTEDDLRRVYKQPGTLVQKKVIDRIDIHCRQFIEASPFLVVATRHPDGYMDVSPRGDPAGFVAVLDEKTLAIPDRPGNNRLDTLTNLLADPEIGLIFMIPTKRETLRVGGRATITTDDGLRERLAHKGKPPLSVIVVSVDRALFQCSKCMVRSGLWDPEKWPEKLDLAPLAVVASDHTGLSLPLESVEEAIEDSIRNKLY